MFLVVLEDVLPGFKGLRRIFGILAVLVGFSSILEVIKGLSKILEGLAGFSGILEILAEF